MTTTATHRSRGGPATERYEQVVIEGISPSIDGGRHPVKGIAGDTIKVEATVFKHGHDSVRVALRWLPPGETTFDERPMALAGAMALDQIALARTIVLTAFAIAFGALMFAIAFGIGGGIARRILEQQFPERPRSGADEMSHL